MRQLTAIEHLAISKLPCVRCLGNELHNLVYLRPAYAGGFCLPRHTVPCSCSRERAAPVRDNLKATLLDEALNAVLCA